LVTYSRNQNPQIFILLFISNYLPRFNQKLSSSITSGNPTIVSIHLRRSLDTPIIITDDIKIGQMAAEHLLERGLRHFALCGFNDAPWSEARKKSFPKRIAKAGFETHIYNQPKSRARRK